MCRQLFATVSSFLMNYLRLVLVLVSLMLSLYQKYMFSYRALHWSTGIWCWKFHVHSTICISDLEGVKLEIKTFSHHCPTIGGTPRGLYLCVIVVF